MTALPLAVALALLAACGPVSKAEDKSAARASASEPAILGDGAGERSIRVGQIVEVRLPAQIAAGLRWDVVELPAGLVMTDSGVEPRKGSVEGSSDMQVFRFRATSPGRADLRLDYGRPWQRERPPVRSVTHRIAVAP